MYRTVHTVVWEIVFCSIFDEEEVVGIRRMRCSNSLCKKRICDIWENRFGVIVIELKYPHCGEVVRVYDKDEKGNLVINEAQAAIVRRVFDEFMNGLNPEVIAAELNSEGVPGCMGEPFSLKR